MSKREITCRVIAALIVTLLATAFVCTAPRQETKEQYLAREARRYDRLVQNPSVVRELRLVLVEVGTITILYEGLARLLMKVVPKRP